MGESHRSFLRDDMLFTVFQVEVANTRAVYRVYYIHGGRIRQVKFSGGACLHTGPVPLALGTCALTLSSLSPLRGAT
jgi:plasmid replication initiation protein